MCVIFFFQAEDGIRDVAVTGVQTCALPISWESSANLSAVSGVCDAGFSTIVLPAARAGASFHDERRKGKFHGTMAPTTPTGWRSVNVKAPGRMASVSPWIFVAQPAK